ncbi:MAG: hypothetical protein IJI67_01105 [Clostridia bacterium]|nr:hypothetical protein [Clostridia bacterium]
MKEVLGRYFRIKDEPRWLVITFFAFEAFCLFTLCYSIYLKNFEFVCLSLTSAFFVFFPWCVQRWLHLEFTPGMKVLVFILAVLAASAGHVYKFYHFIPMYDKILHCYFGFLFAPFGFIIPLVADRNSDKKTHTAMCVLMAFTSVVTVSVIWELIEFGVDTIFHMDLQRDYVVNRMTSYDLFGESTGKMHYLEDITKTVIYTADGESVVFKGGYLDIGLYDSMIDLLVAVIGSGLFSLLYLIKNGKLVGFMVPKILPWDKEEYFKYKADQAAGKEKKE